MRYRRIIGAAVAVAALVSLSVPSLGGEKGFVAPKHTPFLAGQLLVATQKLGPSPASAEDVVDGLEQAPKVINRLFDGSNAGKLIIRISEEP